MPLPGFLKQLRDRIGHDELMLPGVSALVFNDAGEILLNLRSDTRGWAVIGGIPEPGEELAAAVVREVFEETAIRVRPTRITGVYVEPMITYPNGDKVHYVITAFHCIAEPGEPRVNDDESLEVRYFPLNSLPELKPAHKIRIEHALREQPTFFVPVKP